MDQLLRGRSGVICFNDIIATGANDQEHLANLDEVLGQLCAKGFLCMKRQNFLQPTVEYLGHLIDTDGLHTTPNKCGALTTLDLGSGCGFG